MISPTARCLNPDFLTVNVIGGQSHRALREPRENEVILLPEDGMDWETIFRCDFIWVALKTELKNVRGSVTAERRRAIGSRIIRVFGFWLP